MKDKLRSKMIEIRKSIKNKVERTEILIDKFLLNSRGKTIMMYFPLKDEIDIIDIFIFLKAEGKRILFPKIVGEEIVPVETNTFDDFKKNELEILEPTGKKYVGDIDEIIVPGLAFTKEGERLGYGGGYYDKFLSKNKESRTISIAFKEQVLDNIPTEKHDIKIDKVFYI